MNAKDITLYSYCIPYDDGAAPNPFWDVCTLAICKPVIRRVAEIGDWVVGTGSKNSPIGDISTSVVYAMKITDKMTLSEYDQYCGEKKPEKRPDWGNRDFKRRVGDCIYAFSGEEVKLRRSVHTEHNRKRDLGGKNVLLSKHFYYFGDNPIELPENLHEIIKQNQGHKSKSNAPHVRSFLDWLEDENLKINTLYGDPQRKREMIEDPSCASKCAEYRAEEAEIDERIAKSNC
jgi:hypothetical protein